MTDNVPDGAGSGVLEDTPDNAAGPGPDAPPAGEDDGVTLRIVEPLNDPGTILVAVAEPASECVHDAAGGAYGEGYGQVPPRESEVFRDDARVRATAEDLPSGPGSGIPRYNDLVAIIAVRLDGLGPALFFTAEGFSCVPGDKVLVEVEEGQVLGEVSSVMRMNAGHLENGTGSEGKIRPMIRMATDKDILAAKSNAELAGEALGYCRRCVVERGLDMKLVDVLILHDRGKMVFYFTAPARIDFRELVKDLVRRYRTRIELRQIGVRHETQMVGALGNCGMVCCCRRYLRKFAPVAIKMAKEQNVFLNPVKISGICGRLLCCLAYEQQHYDEFYRSCPKLGKKYQTDAGTMRVLRASLFRESVTVLSETGEEVEYGLADWNALNPFRPNAQQQNSRKEPYGEGKQRKGGRRFENGAGERSQEDGDAPDIPAPGPAVDLPAEAPLPPAIVEEEGSWPAQGESRPNEPAVDDSGPDDDGDGGGSIFGLSPRREAAPSKDAAPSQDAAGSDNDGSGRRRRHSRRRKPRAE